MKEGGIIESFGSDLGEDMILEKNKIPRAEIIFPEETVVDLSSAWDSESQMEEFLKAIKKYKWYKKDGLLFSGYDGSSDDEFTSSDGGIWCYDEKEGFETFDYSPLSYAMKYQEAAVAVYDKSKMRRANVDERYVIADPSAIVAILKLKF